MTPVNPQISTWMPIPSHTPSSGTPAGRNQSSNTEPGAAKPAGGNMMGWMPR